MSKHLVGAYGMYWDRESVDWRPGGGPAAWQLMGTRGTARPTVRVCDFRAARGFYLFFDDHGANYVGLARGREGLGARLRKHHMNRSTWSRFCWFAFDDVTDDVLDGWSVVEKRDALDEVDAEVVLRECEALLIEVLGTGRVLKERDGEQIKGQNSMNFLAGSIRWDQLRESDFQHGKAARKVDPAGFTDRWLRSLLEVEEGA